MPTQVPSTQDYANLYERISRLAERLDEVEQLLATKCDHGEVVALVEDSVKKGVQAR